MDYGDEPYRRLYTRRTVTNKRLKWEGRAVMHEMHYEFDRAGVFEFPDDDPADSIAVATELPIKIVRIGLERLFATKTWILRPHAIVWPNYVLAQNCPRSDRVRQQESRERRRDEAIKNPLQNGGQSQNVTNCHDPTVPVTDVTNGHPLHCNAQPSIATLSPAQPVGARERDPTGETLTHTEPDEPESEAPELELDEPEAIATVEPPKPKPKAKPKPHGRSWKRVPADWPGPNAEHRNRAFEYGWSSERLAKQAEKYRLHDFKVSHDDPDRTFHRWIVESDERDPARNGSGNRNGGNRFQGRNSDAIEYARELGNGEAT